MSQTTFVRSNLNVYWYTRHLSTLAASATSHARCVCCFLVCRRHRCSTTRLVPLSLSLSLRRWWTALACSPTSASEPEVNNRCGIDSRFYFVFDLVFHSYFLALVYPKLLIFRADLLTKDYISDQKFSISTCSDTGVVLFWLLY